jgi:ATP-dependent Clp protease protease subunit
MAKKNDDNVNRFLEHGIDIDKRIVHLFDNIDNISVHRVMVGIQLMVSKNSDSPINIYVNSFGGCPYNSFLLYDFIKSYEKSSIEINTICSGSVMSGGSIVFMSGKNRYMYTNSVIMFHSVSSMAEGKVFSELDIEAKECKEIYKQICTIYAINSNKDYNYWYRTLKHVDKYYRINDALDMGLVDGIL